MGRPIITGNFDVSSSLPCTIRYQWRQITPQEE